MGIFNNQRFKINKIDKFTLTITEFDFPWLFWLGRPGAGWGRLGGDFSLKGPSRGTAAVQQTPGPLIELLRRARNRLPRSESQK